MFIRYAEDLANDGENIKTRAKTCVKYDLRNCSKER